MHAYRQADFAVGVIARSPTALAPSQTAATKVAPIGDRAKISPQGIQALQAEEASRPAAESGAIKHGENPTAAADRDSGDEAEATQVVDEGDEAKLNASAAAGTEPATDEEAEEAGDEERGTNEARSPTGETLSQTELHQVTQLKQRDREVRAHEQAHIAAAGGHARGGPSYTFQQGPDGKRYAVGGEVSIDTGKAGDPQATIQKMQTVRRAALAPAEPSAQDRAIANQANFRINQARQELAELQATERRSESEPTEQADDASPDAANRTTDRSDDQADDEARADRSTKPAAGGTAAAIEQLQRQELGL